MQKDRTNYFHPLGFAYYPDGAHDDADELEPGVSPGGKDGESGCASSLTCPAPMYFIGHNYLGSYSNIEDVAAVTVGEDDFGLDTYEKLFFHPVPEWASIPKFNVKLRFDDYTYDKDLFYFCHIHQFMTGRIKLLKDGKPINEDDDPPLGYEYDVPGPFDETCGTFDLDRYELPNAQCPRTFVCDIESEPSNMQHFSNCINAMDCAMFSGMTSGMESGDEDVLFVHQMIPHHQNAVNVSTYTCRPSQKYATLVGI